MRNQLCLVWVIMGSLFLGAVTESLGQGAKSQVKLILGAESAQPGQTVMAGVELKMLPKWHTYWVNGGDAGSPTEITWTLPDGVTAGEILWPQPEKFETAGLYTYGYYDRVVLLVPLTLGADVVAGEYELKANVAWLECEELCVQGETDVSAKLTVGTESKVSAEDADLREWLKKVPPTGAIASAQWTGPGVDDERPFVFGWKSAAASLDFYPLVYDAFDVGHDTEAVSKDSSKKMVSKYEGEWPGSVEGLLVELDENGGITSARRGQLTFGGGEAVTEGDAGNAAGPASSTGLGLVLLFAFFGGLILNIMPCVLPVISLKILGFVNQSQEEPKRVRWLGMMYSFGVLASFMGLAALVIGVQQAGNLASWGMQFQNPQFLVCITVLVTLVALNLFGLFEVTLGGAAMGAASGLAQREGGSGAFFNGVLATALATPCTAPFLASALGYAFIQPPAVIVLVFLVIGLGLAAPYFLLSWFPSMLRFVPKPGAWMERFKVAMGFPMLATAVWLFSLVVGHYGRMGVLWVGMFLVTVSVAAWIWGQFVQRGRSGKPLAMALALTFVAVGYLFGLESKLHWRDSSKTRGVTEGPTADGMWAPWSQEAVAAIRKEGRPILVDFTADWCVTCNVNKETSINVDSVQAKLNELDVVTLKADYTHSDDRIAKELIKYERAGVPLVLVFHKDGTSEPEVLPTVLTPSIVLGALERAVANK